MNRQSAWQGFRKEIEEALALLKTRAGYPARADVPASALPSLLEQCRKIVHSPGTGVPSPIRCIHHFACTGGTLISRCVAAVPNTQVLSEVDPLSTMMQPAFAPTDLILQVRHGLRPLDQGILEEIFLAGLDVLVRTTRANGVDLVLRDHAHSQFCLGAEISERPTLREMLKTAYSLHALVNVRHPLDSYLSLDIKGWNQFKPDDLEGYACRYMAFLDRYDGVEILRYEDFVASPKLQMLRICELLSLSYNEDFQRIFPALHLSGDSGRKGDVICPRPRRAVSEELQAQIGQSITYATLCARLGYDPGPD